MKYNSMLKEMMEGTNYEGAKAYAMTPELELYTAVVTASLSDSFYEKQDERVNRIAALVGKVSPEFVARLAVYARTQMHLRSIPMLLLVEPIYLQRLRDMDSPAMGAAFLSLVIMAALLLCQGQSRVRVLLLTI